MLDFHVPKLEDKPFIDAAFRTGGCLSRSDDYCFGNLYIWRAFYRTRIAYWDAMPLIAFDDEPGGRARYLYPLGDGDKQAALRALSQEPDARVPFTLAGVTEPMKAHLEALFPEKFDFHEERALSDYVYKVDDLIQLSGRKYHGKRNHVARFKRKDWAYEPISAENMAECEAMGEEWFAQNDAAHSSGLQWEQKAVKEAFAHFPELGFSGGLLRQEGRPVAFTIGEPICADTFGLHIEKAFADVEGAYAAINREFLAASCTDYTFVNREEDVGDEGLRKAKLSYHPSMLLTKYTATLKEGETL